MDLSPELFAKLNENMQDAKEKPIFSIRFCKELRNAKRHFGFLLLIFTSCAIGAAGCVGAIVLIVSTFGDEVIQSNPGAFVIIYILVVITLLFLLLFCGTIFGMYCEISYAWSVAKNERNRRRH